MNTTTYATEKQMVAEELAAKYADQDTPCVNCGHSISDGHGKSFCMASDEETGQRCHCEFYEAEMMDFREEQDEREIDPPDGWDVLQCGGF